MPAACCWSVCSSPSWAPPVGTAAGITLLVLAAAGLGALTVADLVGRRVRLGRAVPPPAVVAALLLRHLGTVLVVVGVVRPDLTT